MLWHNKRHTEWLRSSHMAKEEGLATSSWCVLHSNQSEACRSNKAKQIKHIEAWCRMKE